MTQNDTQADRTLTPEQHRVLREHGGGRILIVGGSNAQKSVVESLSGGHLDEVGPADPATMYIVTVPRIGRTNLLRLNY